MIYQPNVLKRCTKCGEYKVATTKCFYRQKTRKGGMVLRPDCRDCREAYDAVHKHTPEYKAYMKALRQQPKHKAKHKEYQRRPEAKAARKAQDSKPERRAAMRAYQQRPERRAACREAARVYAHRHREVIQVKRNAYAQTDRGRTAIKIRNHRRQARVRLLPASFTDADWQRALVYFGGCCAVCGRPPGLWHTLAVDHWIPLDSPNCPGTVPANVVPLCHGIDGCNNSKHNRDPREWLIWRLGLKAAAKKLAEIEEYFRQVA